MRMSLIAAGLMAATASLASAQLVTGTLNGATGAVSRGAAAIDPLPGSDMPTPSIVGHAGHDAGGAKAVRVSAGARVQVARETRCYDGDTYWDATAAPDGYYYCETTGPGAAAGVAVKPKG